MSPQSPLDIDARLDQATEAFLAGDLDLALEICEASLKDMPQNPDGLHLLGLIQHEHGRYDQALSSYRAAAELDPENAEAWFNAGLLFRRNSRWSEAAEHFEKAELLAPGTASISVALARALSYLGDHARAVSVLRCAIGADPKNAELKAVLAEAYGAAGALQAALNAYEEVLELRPGDVRILKSLAHLLFNQRLYEPAMMTASDILELSPADSETRALLFLCKRHLCDWHEFEALTRHVRAEVLARIETGGPPLFHPAGAIHLDLTPVQRRLVAEHWAGHWTANQHHAPLDHSRPRHRARLRIGYFCSNSRASGHLMRGLFEAHDRERFEVFAYANGPAPDADVREDLRRTADRFVELQTSDPRSIAEQMHAHELDLLVDLSGGLDADRIQIIRHRPAPLQVRWLGHPGSTGTKDIDYGIVDEIVLPPDRSDSFTECLAYVTGSYQINDNRRRIARETPARADCRLPAGGFLFCCFNKSYKITPSVFGCWMRILDRVPGSVLWLMDHASTVNENLCREARARGIEPERLVFAPFLERPKHMARLRLAQLCLDTLPYNAHTTASDALSAGVPVLTCPGETFESRVGASLNAAVGMEDMSVDTMQDYEDLAVTLALEPDRLAAFKDRLAANRETFSLFRTQDFVRNLETCYEHMWHVRRAGRPPETFFLKDII